jgi:ribonuclease Z
MRLSPSVGKGEKGRLVRAAGLEQSLEKKRDHEFEISARDRGVVREPWVFHGKRGDTEKRVAAEDVFAAKKATVRAKAQSRGHSAPEDVGEFASAIRARRVAVNHFSAM